MPEWSNVETPMPIRFGNIEFGENASYNQTTTTGLPNPTRIRHTLKNPIVVEYTVPTVTTACATRYGYYQVDMDFLLTGKQQLLKLQMLVDPNRGGSAGPHRLVTDVVDNYYWVQSFDVSQSEGEIQQFYVSITLVENKR